MAADSGGATGGRPEGGTAARPASRSTSWGSLPFRAAVTFRNAAGAPILAGAPYYSRISCQLKVISVQRALPPGMPGGKFATRAGTW